jgi:hypothetical protein
MRIDPNFGLLTRIVVSCAVQLAKAEARHVAIFHAAMMEDAAIAKNQAIKLLQGRVSIRTQHEVGSINFL